MTERVRRVREPVQVYLDERDRELLEALVERTSLSRAELVRRGLRRLSQDLLADARPGQSFELLVGALDAAPDVPPDLAAHHDDYLYGDEVDDARRR